jgi:replicative DNA helicase
MNSEARLINAVCDNKDIASVLSADIDDMFVTHSDVWKGLKDYYFKYQSVPDSSVLVEKFSDFEVVSVQAETAFYIDELRNDYINGKLAHIIQSAALDHGSVSGSELVQRMLRHVSALAKDADVIRDLDLIDFEQAKDFYEKKRQRSIEMGGAPGIQTGFKVMDAMYPTGLAGGHLVVLIGWSGHGKSWMATLMACRAWAAGYKPMIISLEMSPEEVRDRAYTIMGTGEFRHSDFARGSISIDRFDRWANKSLADKHGFVVVSSEGAGRVTPSTVQTKIDQHRPDLVILDYQQLFDSDENEGNEVVRNRRISRDFKRIAVRNDIPIINLTQATFDDPKQTSEPPRIEQVAWSKGIQQDADLALAVHKYEDSDVWAIIARKNRHGEEFEFSLNWSVNDGIIQEVV